MRVLSLPLIGMCIALVSRGCNFWSRHPPRKRILARGLFPLYFLWLVVPEFARVEVQWNRFGNKSTTESAKSHVPASKRRKPASPRRDDSGRSISQVEILCERRSLDIVHYDSPLFAFPFAIRDFSRRVRYSPELYIFANSKDGDRLFNAFENKIEQLFPPARTLMHFVYERSDISPIILPRRCSVSINSGSLPSILVTGMCTFLFHLLTIPR